MKDQFYKISKPIESDLNDFDVFFVESLKSDVKIINTVIKYIVRKHSYDCPAVTAFPIKFAHKDFENWIIEETKN